MCFRPLFCFENNVDNQITCKWIVYKRIGCSEHHLFVLNANDPNLVDVKGWKRLLKKFIVWKMCTIEMIDNCQSSHSLQSFMANTIFDHLEWMSSDRMSYHIPPTGCTITFSHFYSKRGKGLKWNRLTCRQCASIKIGQFFMFSTQHRFPNIYILNVWH